MKKRSKKEKLPTTQPLDIKLLNISKGNITQKKSKLFAIESIEKDSHLRLKRKLESRVYNNLFRILTDKCVLRSAYKKVYLKKDTTKPDYKTQSNTIRPPNDFGNKQLVKLQKKLKSQTWKPMPVKKTWIQKSSNSTLRSLNLTYFDNKIIGETIRMILQAVYEPEFKKKNVNFGFRPKFSTHYCITNIEYKTQGMKYTIKGDIHGAYSLLNHEILMKLLRKRIKDKRFLKAISLLLKTGVFDTIKRDTTYGLVGAAQGQILSPTLWNIYFYEFDKYVFNNLKPQLIKWNEDEIFRNHKEYIKLKTSPNFSVKTNLRYHYVRYGNDWVIFTNCNEKKCSIIKERLATYLLTELRLTLDSTKIKITNLDKAPINFIGFSMRNYPSRLVDKEPYKNQKLYKQRIKITIF